MKKSTFILFLILNFSLFGQTYRTIDGSSNNLSQPDWGAKDTPILRMTGNGYSDLMNEPGGEDRPNPRTISNLLFNQSSDISNALNLSDYWWLWGQFIDHDIILSDENDEYFPIEVPMGDPMFDPMYSGAVEIPMFRTAFDAASGTSLSNPRNHLNANTTWIDASMVYGSDEDRANWLRTNIDGKLKVSTGNLLPYNTTNGELSADIDPTTPSMANANPLVVKYFVAGDVRANEQPLLTILHTIFVREHNRICSILKFSNPSWDDETLYQEARQKVIALIQKITFEDWLPAAGLFLDNYASNDTEINPSLSNTFVSAAFRLGHTLINDSLKVLNNDGSNYDEGGVALRHAFFNSTIITPEGAFEAFLKGAASQAQQELDIKMIDDLRNFLFGPPGAGGLDLASINIQRGRERGMIDYNTIRTEMGLDPITSFQDINENPDDYSMLDSVYGEVDKIDPWVGMLAEDHMDGMAFGPTLNHFLGEQFARLRDCDRYYYENNSNISTQDLLQIQNTNLADILRRNTNIENIQNDLFYALPHEECELSSVYGCVGCYENSIPEAKNLITETYSNGFLLKWTPIPGTIVCQIKGGAVNGANEASILVYDEEPHEKFVSNQILNPGGLYRWRVRCACEITPEIIAGEFSGYTYFIYPAGNLKAYGEGGNVLETQAPLKVVLGPNPFSEQLLVDLKINPGIEDRINLILYDTFGRKVFEMNLSDKQTLLSDLNFDSGMYLYRIMDGTEVIDSGKLIKQ